MIYKSQVLFSLLLISLSLLCSGCGTQPVVKDERNAPPSSTPVAPKIRETQPVVKDEQNAPQITQLKVGKVVFGENYEEVDPAMNNGRIVKIVNSHSAFRPNDPFAYVGMSEEPFGKTKIDMVWSSVSEKGSEIVFLRDTLDVANPAKARNAWSVYKECRFLMGGQKSGKYKLRFFRDDTLLAEGEFTYQADEESN